MLPVIPVVCITPHSLEQVLEEDKMDKCHALHLRQCDYDAIYYFYLSCLDLSVFLHLQFYSSHLTGKSSHLLEKFQSLFLQILFLLLPFSSPLKSMLHSLILYASLWGSAYFSLVSQCPLFWLTLISMSSNSLSISPADSNTLLSQLTENFISSLTFFLP